MENNDNDDEGEDDDDDNELCSIWKLIPVKSDLGPQPPQDPTPVPAARLGSFPPHDGGQHCTRSHQLAEMSDDEFGTTVVEVTVTTTTNTVTTRKKYRVEGD